MKMTEMTIVTWNNQDVDVVLAGYMEDCMCRDPNTGGAFLWHATLAPASGGERSEIDGMDHAIVKGDKLYRNEVYVDRISLFGT